MKPNFTIRKFHMWLDVGWYSGSPFKLFNLTIWETSEWSKQLDFISFVDFQVLKFTLAFGWQK